MIERSLPTAAPAARASHVDRHIGRRIQELRRAIGLTQSDCAKLLGISNQQYHKYEVGRNRIPASRLYDIATIFDIPIDFFFMGLGPMGVVKGNTPEISRAIELLKNFGAIGDPAQQNALCVMARELAATSRNRRG